MYSVDEVLEHLLTSLRSCTRVSVPECACQATNTAAHMLCLAQDGVATQAEFESRFGTRLYFTTTTLDGRKVPTTTHDVHHAHDCVR